MGMFRSRGGLLGCSWLVVDTFGVTMVAYLFLRWITGDRFWPVFALGFIVHLALPAAFVWLPLALLKRRWGSLVVEGICAAAFVSLFGDAFVGHDADPPPTSAPVIAVITYNLGNGLAAPADVVRLLRKIDADVVGLQEVTPEVAEAVTADLADLYPHRVLHPLGVPGKGLLSRFPILGSDLLDLNPGRPDLRVVIDLDGTPATVIVAHTPPPRFGPDGLRDRPDGAAQLLALVEIIEDTAGPLLVLADLNLTRLHDGYGRLEATALRD